MRRFVSFLYGHDGLALFFCALIFGLAWGLGNEAELVPSPWWFSPALQRFCVILMGWTALLHADPLQRLFWSVTDAIAISLPYLAGVVFLPQMEMTIAIDYWLKLGKVSAAAIFGIAVTQAVYSLMPDWRNTPTTRPHR